jgi:Ca-activated chloride channel family protein
MEVGLVSTRFRSLPALMLAGLIGLNGVSVPSDWNASVPNSVPVQTQVMQTTLAERLPLTGVPKDLAEGNALYLQGRYGDAVKRYSEALERHPDVPELYFNLGNAYLRSGDVERAARAYGKFLELTKDPKAASEAIYNLGNAAVMAQDAEKALEMYREALRRDPTNASAKWNLEVLNRLMEEQQKDQQDGKDQQQKKKKGKKDQKQKGQKGEKGEKGDQKGDPSDQEGEEGEEGDPADGKPSDKQGKGKPGEPKPGDAKPTPGEREKGVDGLIDEQAEGRSQRGAARKGAGVWALIGRPRRPPGSGPVLGIGPGPAVVAASSWPSKEDRLPEAPPPRPSDFKAGRARAALTSSR